MLDGEIANHIFRETHGPLQRTYLLAVAVVVELHIDALAVLGDGIGQAALAAHLAIQHFTTGFGDQIAVLGDMGFHLFLRNIRTKDVHGLVIGLRHGRFGVVASGIGAAAGGLMPTSDGSNTLQLHPNGFRDAGNIGFLTPQVLHYSKQHQH